MSKLWHIHSCQLFTSFSFTTLPTLSCDIFLYATSQHFLGSSSSYPLEGRIMYQHNARMPGNCPYRKKNVSTKTIDVPWMCVNHSPAHTKAWLFCLSWIEICKKIPRKRNIYRYVSHPNVKAYCKIMKWHVYLTMKAGEHRLVWHTMRVSGTNCPTSL